MLPFAIGAHGFFARGATPTHSSRGGDASCLFTGIVADVGSVMSVTPSTIAIQCEPDTERRLLPGKSVAVDGVCLTVTSSGARRFSADLASATRRVTTLGRLRVGDSVNLEYPLRVGDDLSGHIVQGHVDGVCSLCTNDDDTITLQLPVELAQYVVPKGSLCVDGVSLTVAQTSGNDVTCAVVPETRRRTTLGRKASVNVEVDAIGKYVAHQVHCQCSACR